MCLFRNRSCSGHCSTVVFADRLKSDVSRECSVVIKVKMCLEEII